MIRIIATSLLLLAAVACASSQPKDDGVRERMERNHEDAQRRFDAAEREAER